MNVRKTSLPVSADENNSLRKDILSLRHCCHVDNTRLVASCSKLNLSHGDMDVPSIKVHSFPGSIMIIDKHCEDHSSDSSNTGSSISISDTMLKVRRLTQVYDEGEIIVGCTVSPLLSSMISDKNSNDITSSIEDPAKTSAKVGDRCYKLPSKAAMILGENDLLIHQFLHEHNTPKISHALFLENKIKKSSEYEINEASSKVQKSKKKSGIGSEVKEKIASLWKQSELLPMSGSGGSPSATYNTGTSGGLQLKDMEKLLRAGKATLEQIKSWSLSFECLLNDKFGLAHFHDFLRSEFSDENIEFWIACEEYRTITNIKKLQSRAVKIYNDYVGVQAAREVNLDSKTRQQTEIDIHNPSPHTFDQAQKRIQALMEKDSYQRFLRSELYGKLLKASEEYHQSQIKPVREFINPSKGLTIGNLGITAQDLSKLTMMTTSKFALIPHSNMITSKVQRENESTKIPLKMIKTPERESSLISTVQPDEPCLPFSKFSLIYTPDNMHK